MTEFWGENLQFWERKNSELWEKSQCSEKKKCVRNFPIVGKKFWILRKKAKFWILREMSEFWEKVKNYGKIFKIQREKKSVLRKSKF